MSSFFKGNSLFSNFGGRWSFPLMYQLYVKMKKPFLRLPLIIPPGSTVPGWATGLTPNSNTMIEFTTSAGVVLSTGGPMTDANGNVKTMDVIFGSNIPTGKTKIRLIDSASKSVETFVNVGGFSLGIGTGIGGI